jgi:cyclopropane fatty-acyl-phospholipid synthase-like methyltransferase
MDEEHRGSHMAFKTSIPKTREKLQDWASAGSFHCQDMKWYHAYLIQKSIQRLCNPADGMYKERWDSEDIESFDWRHHMYIDDETLDHAARQLGLKPGQIVLDIDSAVGHTSRYLCQKYGASVMRVRASDPATSIYHFIASCINFHTGLSKQVYSTADDYFDLQWDKGKCDHIISLLNLYWITPEYHAEFLHLAANHLKVRGKIYIEDYYTVKDLDEEEANTVRRLLHSQIPPTRKEFEANMKKAAFFKIIEFEDVSLQSQLCASQKAICLRKQALETPDDKTFHECAANFYDDVALLLSKGVLAVFRMTAQLRKR